MKPFVEEILDDILQLDPDLQKVKKDLEHLITELIKNKPETPFTKEFKESLKAQIIGEINEQKILNEENSWNWKDMFISLKFWMYSMSSIAVALIFFVIFQNIEQTNIPQQNILLTTENIENQNINTINHVPTNNSIKKAPIKIAKTNIEENQNIIIESAPMMLKSRSINEEQSLVGGYANDTSADNLASPAPIAEEITGILHPTSKGLLNYLNTNEINETINQTTTYENTIYNITINPSTNSITIQTNEDTVINNYLTTDEEAIKIATNFFNKYNILLNKEYNSPLIENDKDTISLYYPSLTPQQEGITTIISKFSQKVIMIKGLPIRK